MRAIPATLTLFCLLLALLPIGTMVWQTLFAGELTAAETADLLFSARAVTLMGHTLLLAVSVTLATTFAGVPLGLLLGKSDLLFRKTLLFLFLIPLLLPPYFIAVAWSDALQLAGVPAERLEGFGGTLFVLFCIYLPVPTLLTLLFLRTVPSALEEAGRLQARWSAVLRHITLPMIAPDILLAAMLVFLLTLGELSVPMYLHYDVYALESFTRFTAFYDFDAAAAATLPLLAVALLLTLAEHRYLRRHTAVPQRFAEKERFVRIGLGRWRGPVGTALWAAAALLVAAPLAALAVKAESPTRLADAFLSAGDALGRSLLYASVGATLLTFFGFFTGYALLRRPFRFTGAVDAATIFLFTLPGTVVAIALIRFWNTPVTAFVYATPLIVTMGWLVKYWALTSRICLVQLSAIPPSMEEAARMAGADWLRRLRYILLPLAARGVAGAWIVAFLFLLRDTDLTMLLYPPGHDTMPIRIFTAMANGSPAHIAALCLLMTGAILLPAAAAWGWFFGREEKR